MKTIKLLLAVGMLSFGTTALAQQVEANKHGNIDPEIRVFLKNLNENSQGKTPIYKLPGTQPSEALTALQNQTPVDMSGVDVSSRTITMDGVTVPLHIVRPSGVEGKLPVFIFYHGGVWIVGNFENHKRLVRDLVVGSNAVAVFVDYTPIPEAKYPTQINEAYAALKWVAQHGDEINVDPNRIAVAGNSVGGNMAAAIALMAKDKNGPELKMELLLYPAVGANFNTSSYTNFGHGRFLTKEFMEFGYGIYAPNLKQRENRYVVPLQATVDQLKGLPYTLIQTAENDPLRDEGEAYGKKLREAGVPAVTTQYVGLIHDFQVLNAIRDLPAVQASIDQAAFTLKRELNKN